MIKGNTEGVRDRILETLETIYEIKSQKYQIAEREIIDIIRNVTLETGREVSVAIDRRGRVSEVAIGDSAQVSLPILDVREKKLRLKSLLDPCPVSTRHLQQCGSHSNARAFDHTH